MDWSGCPDVESDAERVSGAWVVVGTRVPADSLVEHAEDGFSPEEIVTEIFPSVPLSRARRVLAYADAHDPRAARRKPAFRAPAHS